MGDNVFQDDMAIATFKIESPDPQQDMVVHPFDAIALHVCHLMAQTSMFFHLTTESTPI